MRSFVVGLLCLFVVVPAYAGQDWGTEGGGNKACMNEFLPPNIWTLVGYDNAGQPCLTKPDADGVCDATASWDWQLHGTLDLRGPVGSTFKVQLYVGNGGGACHGGTPDPVVCDNPTTHYQMENIQRRLDGGKMDTQVPFEYLIYLAAPWFSVPGDANYYGFWLFVKPSAWTRCVQINYADLVYKDESQ